MYSFVVIQIHYKGEVLMYGKLISVVIPVYFEEAVVEECYRRLTEVLGRMSLAYELVFINDGSRDRTLEILDSISQRDKRVKVISFSRNFGHQVAVTAGVDRAKGDAVIIIDADLQDPPEIIPEMVNLWQKGYEVVYGKRKKRKGETFFKRATAKLFYKFLTRMSDVKIPRDTGDFRLIDRKVVEALKKMPERNRFLRGMISWVGYRQTALEYERDARYAGSTKYPLKKMMKFAIDGILSFSSKPLRLAQYLGFFAVIVALSIFMYAFVYKIAGGKNLVYGWASIMTTVSFLGGVQLICVGILGEYIGRIYDEIKGRPLYIVEREINCDE